MPPAGNEKTKPENVFRFQKEKKTKKEKENKNAQAGNALGYMLKKGLRIDLIFKEGKTIWR